MKTYPVYLNGNWTMTEESVPVINPADGEMVARMSTVPASRVPQIIQDAQTAFEAWRQVPGKARGEFLHKVANELYRRREDVYRFITLENVKHLYQILCYAA